MIKSVVLHVHEDDGFEGRFQVALDICRSFGAHLTCLYVTPYNAYIGFDPLGGISVQAAILENLEATEAKTHRRASGQRRCALGLGIGKRRCGELYCRRVSLG
jgi:hypothetical protein